MENQIEARDLQIERKRFCVQFCENDRGRFLRITEDANGRRNAVIVPIGGLPEFLAAIDQVISPKPEHANV